MNHHKATRYSSVRGFTLVEILVVIGIVTVLVGILLSYLVASRRKAAEATCINQLRQIGAAFRMYMADYDDHRPPRIHSLWPQYVSDRRIFVCPSDLWIRQGGWAWAAWGRENTPPEKWPIPVSYGYFFSYFTNDPLWELAKKQPGRPGYLVCVLHGNQQDTWVTPEGAPYFVGRTLRLCFDESVIARDIRYRGSRTFGVWKLLTDQDGNPPLDAFGSLP